MVICARDSDELARATHELGEDGLDVYAHPEVARRFAVHGIPHFLLFKNGKKLGKMSEFKGESFWLAVVREQALGVSNPSAGA